MVDWAGIVVGLSVGSLGYGWVVSGRVRSQTEFTICLEKFCFFWGYPWDLDVLLTKQREGESHCKQALFTQGLQKTRLQVQQAQNTCLVCPG